MSIPEAIDELWQVFDKGYQYSNDTMLIEKLRCLLDKYLPDSEQDGALLRQLHQCVKEGGFLVKEEKQFLINYFVLLVSDKVDVTEKPVILKQMRGSTSIMDVWPQRQGVRNDFAAETLRKEALLWFIRMYEVLGNLFLCKRGHIQQYRGIELTRALETEKCRLNEDEYGAVAKFFNTAESFLMYNQKPAEIEQNVKVMRKLIWKIREGITKYS